MTDISRESVERLANIADLFAKTMKAWQHKTQKHNEDVRDTLLALRAEVDALEANLAQARVPVVKPLAEAMEDLLGETRGVLPESADTFYDYKRGEFTEARILSAITTAPITPAEAAKVLLEDLDEDEWRKNFIKTLRAIAQDGQS